MRLQGARLNLPRRWGPQDSNAATRSASLLLVPRASLGPHNPDTPYNTTRRGAAGVPRAARPGPPPPAPRAAGRSLGCCGRRGRVAPAVGLPCRQGAPCLQQPTSLSAAPTVCAPTSSRRNSISMRGVQTVCAGASDAFDARACVDQQAFTPVDEFKQIIVCTEIFTPLCAVFHKLRGSDRIAALRCVAALTLVHLLGWPSQSQMYSLPVSAPRCACDDGSEMQAMRLTSIRLNGGWHSIHQGWARDVARRCAGVRGSAGGWVHARIQTVSHACTLHRGNRMWTRMHEFTHACVPLNTCRGRVSACNALQRKRS